MPVFIVDKPLGLSSHDVVRVARKRLGTRRVGHAGTLDPLATGVLVLLSEVDTKLSPFLTGTEKHYLAWVSFGGGTATLDAEGPLITSQEVATLSRSQIESVLPHFLTLCEQRPPQYSAVKRGGVRSYQAARQGQELDLPPRPARYHYIALLDVAASRDDLPSTFTPTPPGAWVASSTGVTFPLPQTLGAFPTALFSVRVAAGTYLRSFARDLGEMLDLPAHLSGLVRTRAGKCDLDVAHPLESLTPSIGLQAEEVLPYPLIHISSEDARRVRQGQRLSLPGQGRLGLVEETGGLVAVVDISSKGMELLRVWANR
jgi:tRNA pseudouridine55 synthase